MLDPNHGSEEEKDELTKLKSKSCDKNPRIDNSKKLTIIMYLSFHHNFIIYKSHNLLF